MGEYTKSKYAAAYSPTDGSGCAAEPGAGAGAVGVAGGGRRLAPVTVEEFSLTIGALRTRRRNAWAAFDRYEGLDRGWLASKARELKNDYLTACLEELELVHRLLGEDYAVAMCDVHTGPNIREQPCLVQGGGA